MSEANMPDLTLPSARSNRDALASRVDVLDKVGVLRTLPDDMHVTTPMVAEFYGVTVDVIRQTVIRNQDEFESDGYTTVTRADVSDKLSLTWSELGFPAKAHTAALFPRRAVLRVGMLLRDSEVARMVRDYLLDAEAGMSEDEIIRSAVSILDRRILALSEKNRELLQKVEEDRPLVERAKTHAGGKGLVHRTDFFREVKAWAQKERGIKVTRDQVFDFLSTRKLNLFVRGNRSDAGQATAWAIEKGYADNKKGTTETTGWNYATGKLTPLGQEYAWDRIIRYVDEHGTLELPALGGAA